MLTEQEIVFWDKLITRVGSPEIARTFYNKLGRPEKLKKVLTEDAKLTMNIGKSIGEGDMTDEIKERAKELSDDEIKRIAMDDLRKDIEQGNLGTVFSRLCRPIYKGMELPREKLEALVRKGLDGSSGNTGFAILSNSMGVCDNLIEYLWDSGAGAELEHSYKILKNDNYKPFVKPEDAKKVVTLYAFSQVVGGEFEEAVKIRKENAEFYDAKLAKKMFEKLVKKASVDEDPRQNKPAANLEYLIGICRSDFAEHLPDFDKLRKKDSKDLEDYCRKHPDKIIKDPVKLEAAKKKYLSRYSRWKEAAQIARFLNGDESVVPSERMDGQGKSFKNERLKKEYALKRGWKYTKPSVAGGIGLLCEAVRSIDNGFMGGFDAEDDILRLLNDEEYVTSVGKDVLAETLNREINEAAVRAPNVIYDLLYGDEFKVGIHKAMIGEKMLRDYVKVDEEKLLSGMISEIRERRSIDSMLARETVFSGSELSFDGGRIEDAYELFRKIVDKGGKLPSKKELDDVVMLRVVSRVQDQGETGLKDSIKIYEDPFNRPYIDDKKVKVLFERLFENYHIKGFVGHSLTAPQFVPYFFTLTGSKLGELFRDNEKLKPYFRLHEFLDSK